MSRKKTTKAGSDKGWLLAIAAANPDSEYYDPDIAVASSVSQSHREAQANGADFETLINDQLPGLIEAGVAVLHKTGPVTRVIGVNPDGTLKVRYIEKGPCDYTGAALGLPVAIEAKSVKSGNTWSVPKEKIHQYKFMMDVVKVAPDAYAGYLIRWVEAGEIRWHSLYGKSYRREEGMLLVDGNLRLIFEGG